MARYTFYILFIVLYQCMISFYVFLSYELLPEKNFELNGLQLNMMSNNSKIKSNAATHLFYVNIAICCAALVQCINILYDIKNGANKVNKSV